LLKCAGSNVACSVRKIVPVEYFIAVTGILFTIFVFYTGVPFSLAKEAVLAAANLPSPAIVERVFSEIKNVFATIWSIIGILTHELVHVSVEQWFHPYETLHKLVINPMWDPYGIVRDLFPNVVVDINAPTNSFAEHVSALVPQQVPPVTTPAPTIGVAPASAVQQGVSAAAPGVAPYAPEAQAEVYSAAATALDCYLPSITQAISGWLLWRVAHWQKTIGVAPASAVQQRVSVTKRTFKYYLSLIARFIIVPTVSLLGIGQLLWVGIFYPLMTTLGVLKWGEDYRFGPAAILDLLHINCNNMEFISLSLFTAVAVIAVAYVCATFIAWLVNVVRLIALRLANGIGSLIKCHTPRVVTRMLSRVAQRKPRVFSFGLFVADLIYQQLINQNIPAIERKDGDNAMIFVQAQWITDALKILKRLGITVDTNFGGPANAMSFILAVLGDEVTLIAPCGDDESGRANIEHLAQAGVDIHAIPLLNGTSASNLVRNMQIGFDDNGNPKFTKDYALDLLPLLGVLYSEYVAGLDIQQGDIVHLGGMDLVLCPDKEKTLRYQAAIDEMVKVARYARERAP